MSKKSEATANLGIDGFKRSFESDLEISQVLAETFKTPSGEATLKYLKSITIDMIHGAATSSEELRHHEGQRFIVGLIQARIQHAARNRASE